MENVIISVAPESPASRTIIEPGDVLRRINGNAIGDVLDYKYFSYDGRLLIELTGADDRIKLVRLRKPEGEDLGLGFGTMLMDKQRSCANKCIFCFIDQLPDGMRETLYYKDDDVRLSFLQGNYVTLTNLSRRDIERIIKLRISPINVSVHTLDPRLRTYMLGTKLAAEGARALKKLAAAGITLNCQIVCCPGINDGAELQAAMEGLFALGRAVNSVSIVPVGLTAHREGLTELEPFDSKLALRTLLQVNAYSGKCLRKRGSRVFYCADELYITAGLKLPPHGYYEGYPQLENGVGMMRLLITEFRDRLNDPANPDPEKQYDESPFPEKQFAEKPYAGEPPPAPGEPFSIATGTLACKYLTNLLKIAAAKYDRINGKVYAIKNRFFGEGVTVSGLVTGGDIISQLKGRDLGSRLLIPENMLRRGDIVFLDDVTLPQLVRELGVPVRVVKQDGADLLDAFLGK